ncbi:hypothetical protein VWY06_02000 [Phaeobacter sp. JH20_10]|uniref:hypothetical protein n=1 Tax=Phaeobacter sp. JH20_10 TaxID=3112469 RepID=UPI003A8986B8
MFRSSYLVVPIWLAFSSQVAAQPANELTPKLVWERFQETCSQVLSDPDAYLSSLARPGEAGERVVSVSPDQMVVSVFNRVANSYDEVELHIVGNRQLRDCSVIGEFYEQDTSQLAQSLVNIVSAEEGVTISGGHAPQDYVEDGKIYAEEAIHLFAIDGIWPEHGVMAVAHVIAGQLQLYVQQATD